MTKIIGPSGVIIDVDSGIAEGLVDGGHARYVTESAPEPVEPTPEPVVPVDQSGGEAVTVTESAPEPVGEQPKGNASIEAWSEFAVANGKTVDGLTRDEIRALFKE